MHKGLCKTRFQTVSERMGTYKQTLLIPDVVGVGTSYAIKNHMKEKMKSDEPPSTFPHPLSKLPHPKYHHPTPPPPPPPPQKKKFKMWRQSQNSQRLYHIFQHFKIPLSNLFFILRFPTQSFRSNPFFIILPTLMASQREFDYTAEWNNKLAHAAMENSEMHKGMCKTRF
ncbi:unnamed protein product [Prunus armeniaca]